MPNNEERNTLKERKNLLQSQYRTLKQELTQVSYDSPEYYAILDDLGSVKFEIVKLRDVLYGNESLKQYLDELLGFILLGERPYNGR